MKTFKQWYLERSEEAKEYLNRLSWVDRTTDDFYRAAKVLDISYDAAIKGPHERHYGGTKSAITAVLCLHAIEADKLSDDDFMKIVQETGLASDTDFLKYFSLRYRRLAAKALFTSTDSEEPLYNLDTVLFLTEDFDNIDWTKLNIDNVMLSQSVQEIIGDEMTMKIAKAKPTMLRIYGTPMNNDIVDKLWFGPDGWTEEDKVRIVREYPSTVRGVQDFMERFIAVDESNLRFVKTFVYWNPPLASQVYRQKKTQEEIDALGEKPLVQSMFRYPTEYRKLFLIAGCCIHQNIGKVNARLVKEVAALLKMYNWDFDTIFACMYPEYVQTPETTEEETV